MTTYERAKAYEYVFQKVKDFFEGKQKMYSDVKQTLEYLFPELAESDDEMIRKELIEYFEWNAQLLNNFDNKDVIAWLEKQGEQKSVDKVKPKFHEGDMIIHKELGGDYIHNSHKIIQVDMLDKEYRLEGGLVAHFSEQDDYELVEQKPVDKVEPKFKVGDWIICDGLNPTLITNIKNNTYDIEFIDGTKGFSNIDYIDSEFHLWTIDDAKDGDVLVTKEDNRPFIFKGLLDSNNPNCPVAYCGIDSVNLFLISPGNHWWSDKEVCPATKEQRDLLFQKMKEAGYEWDAEKKELKKIEQNPADKIESKFKVGDWITNGIDFTFKVMSIKDDMYYRDDDYFIDIETADKTFRLWTIEDAKDGDVLCYKNEISLYNYKIKNHKGVETTFCGFVYYCCYDGKEFVTDSLYSLTEANKCDIHPATKEQCDLLFSKMKEAGYEWDADKKVLVMMGIDNDDEQYEELLEDDRHKDIHEQRICRVHGRCGIRRKERQTAPCCG